MSQTPLINPRPVADLELRPSTTSGHLEHSTYKLYFVIALFVTSLVAFVAQTEITSYLYKRGFNQPILLLVLTHSSWVLIWPIQIAAIALYKHMRRAHKFGYPVLSTVHLKKNIHDSVKNQHKNIYKTLQCIKPDPLVSPNNVHEFFHNGSMIFIAKRIGLLAVILNFAGITWYLAMQWSPASDITAIYNCSAFTALIFAIPILHEKFTWVKLSSVLLALFGVFCVAFGGEKGGDGAVFPRRVWGDTIITVGAVLYGLYEVLYKKLVCPPVDAVSSRRLLAFSNFCASFMGLATLSFGWVFIVVAHVFDLSKFSLVTSLYTWMLIIGSIVSNLVFSLTFLGLMSLTSPVLSSVSSLVTILLVGVFEWAVFGVSITSGQLLGNVLIVVGFVVLSFSYWAEITEEDVDDVDEIDPTDVE